MMLDGKTIIVWAISAVIVLGHGSVWGGEAGTEWNKMVAAAKREGKVVVAAFPNPDARKRIPEAFKKAFGVEVEYLGGRSAQQAERVSRERSSGVYTLDVFIGGPDTMTTRVFAEKMLDPIEPVLILPDVKDKSKWVKGKPWFFDSEGKYMVRLLDQISYNVSVNSKVVNAGEIKSIQGLLDPKWAGKIAALDPTRAGSGSNVAAYWLHLFGKDFLLKFYVGQKVQISSDDRQIADWLGRGTYPIGVGLSATERADLRKDGIDAQAVKFGRGDADRSAGQGMMGLVNKAPHPNAAKLFVNWMLSKEAMEILSEVEGKPVTRSDVNYAHLSPEVIPEPNKEYFDTADWNYVASLRQKLREDVRKILSEAMTKK
jgi:iron(III) transport system substrate-binding protein